MRYWSRNRKEKLEKDGVKFQETGDLIKNSDFISLHLALAQETENFINKERMEKIKPGAVVVNTAPMELVDLNSLEERLKKNDMTFILDHSDEMKQEDLDKLSNYKNCIIYPPIAYVSEEARITKQEMFVGNMGNFLKGSPVNVV